MSDVKICMVCNVEKPITSFKHNPDGTIRRHACNTCMGRRERVRQQIDFLNAFNWKCSCCGEDDPRFLTLDHVNSDGSLHREKLNDQQIKYFAKKEGYPENIYQCLCFNCNCGRSANGGICPHKSINKQNYISEMKATQYNLGRSHVNNNTSNILARVAGRKTQAQGARIEKVEDTLKQLTPEQLEALMLLLKH